MMKKNWISCAVLVAISLYSFVKTESIVWREDLFSRVSAPIERAVRKEMQKSIVANVVNYLEVAWPAIIRDKLFNEIREADLKIQGGFAVCGHEGFRLLLPILKEIGIDVLFTPYVLVGEVYDGVDLVPFSLTTPIIVGPAEKKDIYYAFIGCISNGIRKEIIYDIQHPVDSIIKERPEFHWNLGIDPDLRKQRADEYKDVLSRARFSLCPRGNSANSYRIWESLSAGAIPVVIADDILLPLDGDVVDWNSAIVRVPEKDITNIPAILAQITVKQENIMRENCIKIAKFFEVKGVLKPIYHYYGIPFEQ